MKKYTQLNDLEVYQHSRKLSSLAWHVYSNLSYENKKLMGDQFQRAYDSIGANIAEGYGRYHALDQIRFYHNTRGSQFESFFHRTNLMGERQIISDREFYEFEEITKKLEVKLNNFIKTTRNNAKTK